MEYTIHIEYSSAQIEVSRARMEAARRFDVETDDRTPVLLPVDNEYLLPRLGIGFPDFYDDPEFQLYYELLKWQWLLENLEDDRLIEEELEVYPDFGGVTIAGIFDMAHILWQENRPPYTVPWLESARDVARLKLPHPTDNMGGRKLSYMEEMQFLTGKFHVRLQGEPILPRVSAGWHRGPLAAALDMAGDQIFQWAEDEPNALHDLMAMITETYVEYERITRQLIEAEMEDAYVVHDGAEALSPEAYREFVMPYSMRIYDAFPGQRNLRLRGDINELLEVLPEEGPTYLSGYGPRVDNTYLAETLGGNAVLQGNVDPELLLTGTVDEVKQAAWDVLEAFVEVGGLVLSSGGSVLFDTPVENLNALVYASDEFAEQNQ
jgi:hypothetical protein